MRRHIGDSVHLDAGSLGCFFDERQDVPPCSCEPGGRMISNVFFVFVFQRERMDHSCGCGGGAYYTKIIAHATKGLLTDSAKYS